MRRLYSTFAGGWPGIGLLLLRLVVGTALIVRGGAALWIDPPIRTEITGAFLALFGILLISGLWTPIVGTLAALIEFWQLLALRADVWIFLLLGTIAGALAMLGPGLWSIDAYLFGWKRVEVPPRRSKLTSL